MKAQPSVRARRAALSALAIAGLLVTSSVASLHADAAHASSYPSWSDVVAARQSEVAKAREVKRIESLIAGLEANVQATQAEAIEKGQQLAEAEFAYEQGVVRYEQLRAQADEARERADESQRTAGQLAARLSRASGGKDLSTTLFFNGDDATDLLSQLGRSSKLAEQANFLFERATRDRNTAQSLADQAEVARDALAVLAQEAAEALERAQDAARAAQAALEEQQSHVGTLRAQLAALESDRILTESQYAEAEEIRKEAERRAEEERKRREAEEAAKNPPPPPASSGWYRPSYGGITSPYGWRVNPVHGAYALHAGVDLGASCNTPIWAAASGTVIYAGPYGGYGNYVRVDHGGGVTTSYAHIVDGGILVGYGQGVSGGQQIARIGTTGNSTGCHLHFEVRTNGNTIDPVPFLNARGVAL